MLLGRPVPYFLIMVGLLMINVPLLHNIKEKKKNTQEHCMATVLNKCVALCTIPLEKVESEHSTHMPCGHLGDYFTVLC